MTGSTPDGCMPASACSRCKAEPPGQCEQFAHPIWPLSSLKQRDQCAAQSLPRQRLRPLLSRSVLSRLNQSQRRLPARRRAPTRPRSQFRSSCNPRRQHQRAHLDRSPKLRQRRCPHRRSGQNRRANQRLWHKRHSGHRPRRHLPLLTRPRGQRP